MSAPDTNEHNDDAAEAVPSARAMKIASTVRWILIAVCGALAVAALVIGVVPSLRDAGRSGDAPAVHGKTIYHCPMHPQIRSDHPGDCPICGMDLVPVNAKAPAKAHASDVPRRADVHLDEGRLREIGVVSVVVAPRSFTAQLRAPAEVAIDESRVALVETRFAGWISKLFVRTRGERVRRGQQVATLRSPDLYQAESELSAAVRASAVLGQAREALVAQARARLEALGVPNGEVERVAGGGEPRTELALTAPRAGVVVGTPAALGSYVTPGAPVFLIANLETVWVLADLPESFAARVSVGETATIETPLAPGERYSGQVTLLDPLVDSRTRTRRARIEVRGAAATLVPGAVAYAHFALESVTSLGVPRDAVLTAAARNHVFVDLGSGHFSPREVRIGVEQDGWVQVLEGLREGERVAHTAAFMIDAESQLRATAAGSATAHHE